jgi:hypothetical protein
MNGNNFNNAENLTFFVNLQLRSLQFFQVIIIIFLLSEMNLLINVEFNLNRFMLC